MAHTVPTDKEYDVFIKQQGIALGEFEASMRRDGLTPAQQKEKRAAFMKNQLEAAQLYKSGEIPKEKAAAAGEKSAAYEAGEGFVEGAKNLANAAIDGIKSMVGYGSDTADAVADGTADDKLKKTGEGWGESIGKFFKGTGWSGAIGMLLGGLLGYGISGIFGGGILGTVVAIPLAVGFGLMGRDFANRTFGGKSDKPAAGEGKTAERGTAPERTPEHSVAPFFTEQQPTPPLQPGTNFQNNRTAIGALSELPTSERFPTSNASLATVTPGQTFSSNSSSVGTVAPFFS